MIQIQLSVIQTQLSLHKLENKNFKKDTAEHEDHLNILEREVKKKTC